MVRGRRTRAATAVVNNLPISHNSILIQDTNSAIQSKTSVINENAQSRILNDDHQCYASPKRKESKIDEVDNIHLKTRSRCNGTNLPQTRSSKNKNNSKEKCAQKQINQQWEEIQQQKTITKYFTSATSQQSCTLSSTKNYQINENIMYTICPKETNSAVVERKSEEEEEEDDYSDGSNKTDLMNGSMNCSGLNISNKFNDKQNNFETFLKNSLIENDLNFSQKNNDQISNHNECSTNSSSSSIISLPISRNNDVLEKSVSLEASKNNLFLQEPVLSLNIDKSPNQPSSIKINKSFEVESVFSAVNLNSNCNSICLNGFNKIVTLKSSPKRSVSSETESILLNNCNLNSSSNNTNNICNNYMNSSNNKLKNNKNNNNNNYNNNINNINNKILNNIGILLSIDNSSNDSGVIVDRNNMTNNSEQQNQINEDNKIKNTKQRDELSPSKRRKPTTPHRILCPSPVKIPYVDKSVTISNNLEIKPYSNKKNTATYDVVNGGKNRYPKSRRRLNTPISENSSTSLSHSNIISLTDSKKNSKQQQKTILNSAKNPTAQQNSNNNKKNTQIKLINNTVPSQQNIHLLPNILPLQNETNIIDEEVTSRSVVAAMKPPIARTVQQKQLHATDFYPVRRSIRKTKTAVEEEMMRTLEKAILENREDGLEVKDFDGKGRGIITTKKFTRGEFVVEYIGDLIDMNEANEREQRYSLDENAGCYMYYFKHKNQQYCIDATAETGKLGRLVNHSRNGNLVTKVVLIKSKPHLVLIARDDIDAGIELTYDYGDRSKEALQHHPWLAL